MKLSGSDCRCIVSLITKNERKTDLTEKRGTL